MRSIRSRIWLSVVLCALAIAIVGVTNLSSVRSTAALPKQIYNHSYAVGIAVRDLRGDVNVMHTELSDLARTPSKLALRRFEMRMGEIDQRVDFLKATIMDRFSGNPLLVDRAFAALADWNAVRADVVKAIQASDRVTAYTLMKTEGYNQLKYLEEHLARLIGSANASSAALSAQADIMLTSAVYEIWAAILLSLILLACAARMVLGALVRPVQEISGAMSSIAMGNLSTVIPHDERDDEIGEIARSSKVFLNHAIAIQESSIDLLTLLPNRRQMLEHIAIEQLDPDRGAGEGVLLHVDLDNFVEVNEMWGREVGDRLLIDTAFSLRSLQERGDFIAREGADSFLWYRSGPVTLAQAQSLAAHIQARILDRSSDHDDEYPASCSIGICLCDDAVDPEKLLMRAEDAYLDAKRRARGSIATYTIEMDARLLRRRETLRGLRFAINHDEIAPFFQPQVDARSGALHGFEALARWHHPEHGVLSPWQFLPVAQSAGLLGAISEIMISKALAQLADWRRIGLHVPRISINLDAADLGRDDFADRLMLELERYGLGPKDICLELLETAMIEDGETPVSKSLERLCELGCPIELDDFGTGHAAISSLQLITLNGIKIDRCFVTNVHKRPQQQKLINAMLRLAHALQISTVAEGIESVDERSMLLDMGCDVLQGFGIARPMAGEDATAWLRKFTPEVGRMVPLREIA
ncbi:MAG: EAL domain-containing protein [Pseudomonadota bacterium]